MRSRYLFSLSLWLPLSFISLAGCAPKQVILNTAYDFSKVWRITVMPLEGPGGPAATDEFVKELVATGLIVTDAHHPGDVILRGSVVDYQSNNQLMIFLGGDNPMVTPSVQATPEGTTMGVHKTQVASVMASVGIQARLLDASSHNIVWADSYSYEGLDLPAALAGVVGSLKQSLGRVMPQMKPRIPS